MFDPGWALSKKTQGWSSRRIADEVYATTGVQVTTRAIDKAIATHKARSGERPAPVWPWDILSKHKGAQYRALLLLYYWEKGEPLSEEEQGTVRDLLRWLEQWEAVFTYHRKSGFHMVARKREDSESYFQSREFDPTSGQLIVG